jgi:aminoglycoside 2'-N-acetyltransferase I
MMDLRVIPSAKADEDDLHRLRRLLDEAFDGDFSDDDWEHALGGWHVVVLEKGAAVSHAAVVPRGIDIGARRLRAGYVEAVATVPARRREGLASVAMTAVAGLVHRFFEVGVLSTALPAFYERLGWERWRGPSFVRRGGRLVRTEDEDDGILVLRGAQSRDLDLTDRIVCDARTGDDW